MRGRATGQVFSAPMDPRTGLPVVGMVGAGQLARMTHQAAIALGQSLRVLAASSEDGAALVAADVHLGHHTDLDALRAFARGCDVVGGRFPSAAASYRCWSAGWPSHSWKRVSPSCASPAGISERSASSAPKYRAWGSTTTSRGSLRATRP